jgi:hypothetical protein
LLALLVFLAMIFGARISTGALIETLFGIPAPNPVEVDCHPLGVNGKPLRMEGNAENG